MGSEKAERIQTSFLNAIEKKGVDMVGAPTA